MRNPRWGAHCLPLDFRVNSDDPVVFTVCCIQLLWGALRSVQQFCQVEACVWCAPMKSTSRESLPATLILQSTVTAPPTHTALARKCVYCACRHAVISVHAHTEEQTHCILVRKGIKAVLLQLASITWPHQTSSIADMHVEFALWRDFFPLEDLWVFI